jgi:hypothetical protein
VDAPQNGGRPSRSARSSSSSEGFPATPKARKIGDIRKEVRTRGLEPQGLDRPKLLALLLEGAALDALLLSELKQRVRQQGGKVSGSKSVLIKRLLQPPKGSDPSETKDKKKMAGVKSKTKPSKTRGSKKRKTTATSRLGAGQQHAKRIKALEADKDSLEEQVASLLRDSAVHVALNKIQMESVKHETEARMAKAELAHERASSQVAVEKARNVMPVNLARQLINTHAIAFGASSTRGQVPTSTTRGYCDIREFTEEEAVQFVMDLGQPFEKYREALVDSSLDGELLAALTDDELQTDIGVTNKIHRKKILSAIKKSVS